MFYFLENKIPKKYFGTPNSISVSVSVSGQYRKFGIGTKKVPPVVPKYRNTEMHSVPTALVFDIRSTVNTIISAPPKITAPL